MHAYEFKGEFEFMKKDRVSIEYYILSHDSITNLCQDLQQEVLLLFNTEKFNLDQQKTSWLSSQRRTGNASWATKIR